MNLFDDLTKNYFLSAQKQIFEVKKSYVNIGEAQKVAKCMNYIFIKIDIETDLKKFFLSRDMVLTFVNSLVPTVRRALCDQTPEVRAAAAKTFDSLHNTVGSRYDFFYLAVT